MIRKICESCGKEFTPKARGAIGRAQRTCSSACKGITMRGIPKNRKCKTKHIERICPQCGKPFLFLESRLKYNQNKFCSRQCTNGARSRPLYERMQSRLTLSENGCMRWNGATNNKGYGFIVSMLPKKHILLTHRVAYEQAYGPISEGFCVLHKCDNPPCCNPEHLFLGTIADNNRDMREKGRAKNQFT
jgi:hypothetical protein